MLGARARSQNFQLEAPLAFHSSPGNGGGTFLLVMSRRRPRVFVLSSDDGGGWAGRRGPAGVGRARQVTQEVARCAGGNQDGVEETDGKVGRGLGRWRRMWLGKYSGGQVGSRLMSDR